MKLLIYGLNYSPELIGIGKYTGEMAEWFVERGHEVKVVTAHPYYPMWKIREGYYGWRYTKNKVHGVNVYRCPLWVPKGLSGIKRILHLISFTITSFPIVLFQCIFWRPDTLFCIAPAIFCAPGACIAARLTGVKRWLHIQDFEIDAAYELGILKNKLMKRIATFFEKRIMGYFNAVSAISEKMLERLDIKGVNHEKQVIFYNWADTKQIFPIQGPNPIRDKFRISDDAIVALYSGNMGAKQGLEIIIEAARRMKFNTDILFVMCGDGIIRDQIQDLVGDFGNIRFIPLQPLSDLNNLLNLADIHLLPQKKDVADLVMPSKLTGMLASGRPIVATAQPETQLARIVGSCGRVVEPDNPEAFSQAIVELAERVEKRKELGKMARTFAVDRWSKDRILEGVEKKLMKLVDRDRTLGS